MNWMEVHIDTNHQGLETVELFLSAHGIDDVVIDDEEEFQEFLEDNRPHWDYVDEQLTTHMQGRSRVTFYLHSDDDGFSKLAEVRLALSELKREVSGCGTLLMTLESVEDADWENNWKQYYKPMEIGERLLVVPQWEQASSEERVTLVLDPGLAFGTGSHATTRLCLEALEREVHGGERVLDLGCGSGILSIAALRLGAASAMAVDIDDQCLNTAYENAALNGILREEYAVRIGDILEDRALQTEVGCDYDLVLANIVADVIIGLAPVVHRFLRSGGRFLCSGIIDGREEETAAKLRQSGLEILESRSEEGWYFFLCR